MLNRCNTGGDYVMGVGVLMSVRWRATKCGGNVGGSYGDMG